MNDIRLDIPVYLVWNWGLDETAEFPEERTVRLNIMYGDDPSSKSFLAIADKLDRGEVLSDQEINSLLSMVYRFGQNDFQPQDKRSVSIGDVIDLEENGLWFVSSYGFKPILEKEFEHLVDGELDTPGSSYFWRRD